MSRTRSTPGSTPLIDTPIIPDDNPEIVAARQHGIPVLSRAQALELIMADRRVIGVGGTHGKTTTTSMITVALQQCGVDPSFAIGSEVNDLGSNAHTGRGDLFVVEADESDGAFLHMDPVAVVVTNVEPDHLDHWGDFASLELAFDEFVDLVAPQRRLRGAVRRSRRKRRTGRTGARPGDPGGHLRHHRRQRLPHRDPGQPERRATAST